MTNANAIKDLRPKSTLTIKVVGGLTGEEYAGEFKVWTVLTQGQMLERDRLRRQSLGANADAAPIRTGSTAQVLADFQVRVFEAPQWFYASNYCQDLVDEEPMVALWEAIIKAENEFIEERQKKAEAAKGKLRDIASE